MRFMILGLALVASAANARDWPEAGGWDVSEMDEGCLIHLAYEGEGETELALALYQDKVILSAVNANWSTVKDKRYSLKYVLNGQVYGSDDDALDVGVLIDGKKGFMTQFNPSFVTHFAAGNNLKIYNGTTLVDSLSLSGTGVAVAALKRCKASVDAKLRAEARERDRLSHIPKDPFAEDK